MAVSTTDREKRVGLHLPVEVSGQDAAGASFHETTRTLNISGGGVLFESHRHLLVGARLTLAIQIPDSLRKHFRCPSQEEQGRGLSQKEDGGGWVAPREYSSYIFNEAILGKRDKPYEAPLGRIGMIRHASDVMLAMDGRPRSEDDNWLMIFDYGPDDTLADWERQIQQGTLGKQSLDRLRHRGRANVLFVDGHVDTIPLTEGAMKRVGVSHGVYQ